MKRQWAYSLVASSLLLSAPLTLNAREPKTPNPCRDLERDLDDQVNTLHRHQDAELAQCRQSNGKNSEVCRAMKEYQKLDLQALRDQRQDELDRCHGPLSHVHHLPGATQNESCDVYDRDRDRYARHKYPQGPPSKEPPYKEPPKHAPVGHNPPDHDGDSKHPHDQDAGATRNAGNSSSGSLHSGGSSNGHSGSGSGSGGGSGSSSYHASSGSSSSSSSGSSYSGHSGSSGSSSGSSSSTGSSSSSSSSHDSGGRPK
ncbi:MAG TPA: hypothetical protein VJS37_15835 [Terriglobales bacterium]|nr:hypothetical protein [Terriglobales bacterium]